MAGVVSWPSAGRQYESLAKVKIMNYRIRLLLLCSAAVVVGIPYPLRAGEAFSLFDGKTLDQWTTVEGEPVTTGWEAVKRFSEEFPSSFILSSVGSKITLS